MPGEIPTISAAAARLGAAERKPKQRGPRTAPAGGPPAGGKRPQAAARGPEAPRPGRRPGQAPGREPPGPKPRGGEAGPRDEGQQAAGQGGDPARNPRSARAAPARSKADRTGRPQRSKGKAEAQRGQRAPTEPHSGAHGPSGEAGGNGPGPGRARAEKARGG